MATPTPITTSKAAPTSTRPPTPAAPTKTPTSELAAYRFPEVIDPNRRYLFYLHGKIIEDQGIPAVSEDYGEYEYQVILDKLQAYDFVVISEQRPKDTDGVRYAQHVVEQVNLLLKAGVPPEKITVMGASKGAAIAVIVSSLLKNTKTNFVLLGGCHPDTVDEFIQNRISLHGNVLAIYDSADDLAGSCQELFTFSEGKGIGQYDEIVLHVGTGHGILYKPLDEWTIPTVEWAREGSQP